MIVKFFRELTTIEEEQIELDGMLFLAIQRPVEELKMFLENGANPNAKDENGRTVLMYAKTAEQTEALIKAGADVNAKDKNGRTALNRALLNEDHELVQVLREAMNKDVHNNMKSEEIKRKIQEKKVLICQRKETIYLLNVNVRKMYRM